MAVAFTRNRLKNTVTLRTLPGGAFTPDAASTLAELQRVGPQGLLLVGACQRLYIIEERDGNQHRWEFNSDAVRAMSPAETYPGKVRFTAELHRTDLYDANLMEAFGFPSANLAEQLKAILLVIESPVPLGEDGQPLVIEDATGKHQFKPRTYIIPGCWFDGIQIHYDSTDTDLKHVVEARMTTMGLIVPASAL